MDKLIEKKEWFLEYSVEQEFFHIDSLDRILEANRDMCSRRVSSGYVILDGPMFYDNLLHSMKYWSKKLGVVMTELDGRRFIVTLKGERLNLPKKRNMDGIKKRRV